MKIANQYSFGPAICFKNSNFFHEKILKVFSPSEIMLMFKYIYLRWDRDNSSLKEIIKKTNSLEEIKDLIYINLCNMVNMDKFIKNIIDSKRVQGLIKSLSAD